ncbi:MAG: hypothetical protein AUK47_08245 [Deltaproteobacteria bacterium CG2_30_63_29]|nr:MAG: hypothetical protein AUK47_08245 [Deltaproteobacteria bacterium CG2_30_63_29]
MSASETTSRRQVGWGIVLMLGASVCYALMGVSVKIAGRDLPLLTLLLGRSAMLVVASFLLLKFRGSPARPGNPRLILGRSATGFVAMGFYYYAITQIPLANAVTLQFMSPLFVAFFSAKLLGERVGTTLLLCIVLAGIGATLVVAPDLSTFGGDSLFALAAAVLAGVAYVMVRELRKTDTPETIVFNFAVFSLVFSSPAVFLLDRVPTPVEFAALVGTGLFAFGGQILMTYSYRLLEVAFASVFSYSTVLFSALFGFVALGEQPTLLAALGAALIVGTGVIVSVAERVPPAP